MHFTYFLAPLAFASSVLAAPALDPSSSPVSKRRTNSATDRSSWGDYDLSTNYYNEAPDTGVTHEYYFDITNATAAPDGVERVVLSINEYCGLGRYCR